MPPNAEAYRKKLRRARSVSRQESAAGRDIGAIPPVKDPARKRAALQSFRAFCDSYFATHRFYLPWSRDHAKIVARMELVVRDGGMFATAMPRGFGKTSICECAVLWAMLGGYHQFTMLVAAAERNALKMLESIKGELERNDELAEDFPEVCQPIRLLEGESRRCIGQTHNGQRTCIGWGADEIRLPMIAGSRAAGAVVRVAGITGNIRGAKHQRPDGRSVRPSIVIIDDPQDDESALSPSQCDRRLRTINGAILKLAGPNVPISAIMPCTVITNGDLADTVLDRGKNPHWQGERTKMLYSLPTNAGLWAQYKQLREDGLRSGAGTQAATEFYVANRAAMDEGADPAWPELYNPDEVSAVQHAMNLLYQDERSFWAECQNEPLSDIAADGGIQTVEQVCARVNGYDRGIVPRPVEHLTAYVDVHKAIHYAVVCGWESTFTGYVIDVLHYPDQGRAHFLHRDLSRTLQNELPTAGLEAQVYAGLERIIDAVCQRDYVRDDGRTMRVERCLIDANWGDMTNTVYAFCRQSKHAAALLPSHGKYIGAAGRPMGEWTKRPGDRVGLNWRIPISTGDRILRRVFIDTNFWKTFVHARLSTPIGDPGAMTLYGRAPEAHRMLAEHVTLSEYRVRPDDTDGKVRRTVWEWKPRRSDPDNHLFDCLVGATVAASVLGVSLKLPGTAPQKDQAISMAALRRGRR